MTSIDFFIGVGISALAMVAAIWVVVSDGSDSSTLGLMCISLAVFVLTLADAHTQSHAKNRVARFPFPGPLMLSAPVWQRILLCMMLLVFAAVPLLYGAIAGGTRLGDWQNRLGAGAAGLPFLLGALFVLPRRKLVLSIEGLEYRSLWFAYSYRWSEFSKFYVTGIRWSYLMCEFAHRRRFTPVGLMIASPMGLSKHDLRMLLTEWHARALSHEGRFDQIGRLPTT